MRVDEVTDRYKKGVDTRRLYKFEANYFWGTEASRVLPMGELKALAEQIWAKYGKGKPMPKIAAGPGTPHGNKLFSYSQGGYIQLARSQRNKLVLIHELIHELGYDDHDAGFINFYLPMLIDVLKLDKEELLAAARQYKLI
jgi:hypothetical protein